MQPRYRAERPRGRLLPTHRRFSMDVRLDRVDRHQSYLSSQRKCEVCMKNSKKGGKGGRSSKAIALKSDIALIKSLFAVKPIKNYNLLKNLLLKNLLLNLFVVRRCGFLFLLSMLNEKFKERYNCCILLSKFTQL